MPKTSPIHGSKWRRARLEYIRQHPHCAGCGGVVKLTGSRSDPMVGVVDHKIPHRGNLKLFWDRGNWQTMHKGCHDGWKQSLEKSGREGGCDADGNPVDPAHHWNQGEGGSKSRNRRVSATGRPVFFACWRFSNFSFSGAR